MRADGRPTDSPGRLRRAGARLRAALVRRAAVDARAVATLRIALGCLLVVDLAGRAGRLVVFYTDAGVLPRAALRAAYPTVSTLSVHARWGDARPQAVLFVVAAVAAVALAVGHRSRLAAVVSWVLLVSLHARNPVLLNGGDSLLRRTLFWSLFVPLGRRWSLDALRGVGDGRRTAPGGEGAAGATAPGRVVGLATAALLAQPVLVYGANALIKLRGSAWPSGRAIRLVFALDRFTTPAGEALAAAAGPSLSALGYAWLALLVASPLLVVVRGRARTALAAAFAAGHLGMLLTMRLGPFPLVAVAALLPYVHAGAWDSVEALGAWVARRAGGGAAARAHAAGSRRGPPSRDAPVADDRPRALPRPATRRRLARVLLVGLFGIVVAANAVSLGVVAVDGVDAAETPRWDMFAPEPPDEREWLVASGVTAAGERVDVADPGDDDPRDRPPFRGARWRKYAVSLAWGEEPRLERPLAEGLCRRWNRSHDVGLDRVTVDVVTRPVSPDGSVGEPSTRRLVAHDCGTGRERERGRGRGRGTG